MVSLDIDFILQNELSLEAFSVHGDEEGLTQQSIVLRKLCCNRISGIYLSCE